MATPELIPWGEAVLCLDCQRVSHSRGDCEGCGSSALVSLPRVLDRSVSAAQIHRIARSSGIPIPRCRPREAVLPGGEMRIGPAPAEVLTLDDRRAIKSQERSARELARAEIDRYLASKEAACSSPLC